MLTKSKIALAAVLLLGVASVAQAAGRDDADRSGGYRVGPTGQSVQDGVNPVDHRSLARGAYASTRSQTAKKPDGVVHSPASEPANIGIQDQFFSETAGE
jgi:hypothetical protein